MNAKVTRVVGALVEAGPCSGVGLGELVEIGQTRLMAEVLRKDGSQITAQVFEETAGLQLGSEIVPTGAPLMAELGPGLLGSVLDGVGRRLVDVAERSGDMITAGMSSTTLSRTKRWRFEPRVAVGDEVAPGDVIGAVQETDQIEHRILCPINTTGRVARIETGEFSVHDSVAELEDGTSLTMLQRWPIQRPRPVAEKLRSEQPFVTGQRIFDLLFPAAEGGTVVVPGGFGTGKTVIEQSLAKHAHADVVVYVGCGERGNEIAEVLSEFADLVDGRGQPVMQRTVLVVNTSNMPVAARQASIYLGLTVAEYYRDMGYRVAMMADSISRWAEALRELGSRLHEMPGEEGYPTYLSSRLAKVHERAGRTQAMGAPRREGTLTLINAVSPPGGDFSEPVTQACLRVAGALWALDPRLAHQRQYPAVDWQGSYSLYARAMCAWFAADLGVEWEHVRVELVRLLQRDRQLWDIAELVGTDALDDAGRLLLRVAALIRDAVLGQSAYDANDAFSPPAKTFALARLCLELHERAGRVLESGTKTYAELSLSDAGRAIVALRDGAAEDVVELIARAETAIGALGEDARP